MTRTYGESCSLWSQQSVFAPGYSKFGVLPTAFFVQFGVALGSAEITALVPTEESEDVTSPLLARQQIETYTGLDQH